MSLLHRPHGRQLTQFACSAAVVAFLPTSGLQAETELRIDTYNVKFLDAARLPLEGNMAHMLCPVLDPPNQGESCLNTGGVNSATYLASEVTEGVQIQFQP